MGLSLWQRVKGFLVSPVTVLLVRVRLVEGAGHDAEDGKTGKPGLVTGGPQPSTLSLFVGFVGSKDLLKKIAFLSCCDRVGGGLLL